MSKKKITLLMTSIISAIMLMIIPNISKAKEPTTPVYFGVSTIRENSSTNVYNGHDAGKNIGYAIGNPNSNGSTGTLRTGANIWNIMTYPNNNPGTTGTEGNYYCVREGAGFTNSDTTLVTVKQYNNSFEIKLDNKATITSNVGYLNGISDNDYKALIILSNLLYLGGTDAERIAFLDSVGINTDLEGEYSEYDVLLTESDIKAVQQAALWYYSNRHGQTISNQWSTLYDNTSKDSWLNYTVDGNTYSSMSDYDFGRNAFGGNAGSGLDRQAQANILYRYLINTTNNMVNSNATIENKVKIIVYTNITDQNDTQPIIYIERIPQEVKEFDLALRKYITQVDGNVINTRIPDINVSKIDTEGTAEYKHRKDPVVVKNGSTVIYNLTVYNEGEKAGRATKIIDQLPEGLRFNRLVDANGFTASYDSNSNIVTITRDSNNTTNLDAYTANNLKSETIRVECTVTETASTEADKILTNVAWIAEEYDAVDKVTITNQDKKDRDSKPSDAPNVNKGNMQNYIGNNSNKTNLTDPTCHYKGQEDDDDFEKLILEKENENSYNIVLVKEDSTGEQLNSKATFEVNGTRMEVTGRLNIATDVKITSSNVNQPDTYIIKELVAPDEYCKFDGTITIQVNKTIENGTYKVKDINYTVTDSNGNNIKGTENDPANVYLNESGNIYVEVKNYQFDLKLIKRITEVNGEMVPERLQDVDITNLANGTATTATYKMDKNPVAVKNGDIVKYTFRVYNEGEIDGYASEITENIPEGLEFIWSDKIDDSQIDADTSLSDEEKEAIKYNQARWNIETIDKNTNKVEVITTDYLAKGNGDEIRTAGANLIKAFDSSKPYKNTINDKNPDYKEISVYLRVVAEDSTNTIIRNEACISEDTDKNGNPVDDRDSDTEQWKKEDDNKYYDDDNKWPVYKEDDEDYDNIILKAFDLSLRKFIIAVSKDQNIEESEYLRNSDKTYQRAPIVDTSKLNTTDENGKLITTAIYNHTKEPVEVVKNDYVVYMIRVYNEGDIDGYASEIKDHLPPYLQYVDNDFNKQYGWSASEDGRTITTTYLDGHMIEKTTRNSDGKIILSYKELPIMCKVTDNAEGKITNIADITVYKDENKKPVSDRDSQINNVKVPADKDFPSYKDDETGDYIPGQQDDDDFDKLIVKEFDLALRKFITAVDDNAVDSRYPKLQYNKETNHITYTHPKEEAPVEVATNNIVTYTIRVYNEGDVDGFASRVTDDLPEGLEYLPNHELNKEYRWVMYDKDGKETDNVTEAVKITTDYLSKEQGEARMEADGNMKENPALLEAFDKEQGITDTNPDYADVKVAFKVTEPNGSSKVIINSAQISEDTDKDGNPIDDKDSTPDEWNEGEDDQDKEYIKLKYFDLALRKFITAVDDEKVDSRYPNLEYDAEKNHITYTHPKEEAPVEVVTNNIVTYTIRVYNEGEIDGFASKVSDDIPDGLEYLPKHELNKEYRWVMYDKDGKETDKVADAVKITTDYLSKEQGEARMEEDDSLEENPALLKAFDKEQGITDTNPDYADVKVAFKVTEPNGSSRVIINSAQISEDTDKDGNPVDDKDSTPDEWNDGEDDQDKEYIKLNYFDLALRKWVTHAIVIEDGKETVTPTGHKAEDDPEQVVKVELNRKKLSSLQVKFKYSIRVTNEGDIAGYAKEITDYVPKGLKFDAKDNPDWKDEGNNVISTTKLENTLLQPGQSVEVQVILTWINGQDNLGLKTNIAEISKDYNDKGVPDRDSTPDNQIPGEDDQDDAPVLLSISTGRAKTYIALSVVILVIIAGGIVTIKKFVL